MTAVDSRPAGLVGSTTMFRRSIGLTIRSYVALTKPRIIELLLVTTVPTMFLAARGCPSLWLVAATLRRRHPGGGQRQRAQLLPRPRHRRAHAPHERRPLVTGVMPAWRALIFGIILGRLAVLWPHGQPAVGALSLAAILIYVFGYTMGLKRRTPQNIVWGGAAGCMPVLIGWSAVTNSLGWAPVILFRIIFFWTPPHYWPLSMKCREDYAAAGVPMLPVVADNLVVARRIVVYSWVMVAVSLLLWPVAHTGWLYPVAAVVLGVLWLVEAHKLYGRAKAGAAGAALKEMRLFHWSITYLSLLFVAVAVDPLLFAG